jgi:hypothetical protein
MNALLTYNPQTRITAREALNHPYFRASPFPVDPDVMPTFPTLHTKVHNMCTRGDMCVCVCVCLGHTEEGIRWHTKYCDRRAIHCVLMSTNYKYPCVPKHALRNCPNTPIAPIAPIAPNTPNTPITPITPTLLHCYTVHIYVYAFKNSAHAAFQSVRRGKQKPDKAAEERALRGGSRAQQQQQDKRASESTSGRTSYPIHNGGNNGSDVNAKRQRVGGGGAGILAAPRQSNPGGLGGRNAATREAWTGGGGD